MNPLPAAAQHWRRNPAWAFLGSQVSFEACGELLGCLAGDESRNEQCWFIPDILLQYFSDVKAKPSEKKNTYMEYTGLDPVAGLKEQDYFDYLDLEHQRC